MTTATAVRWGCLAPGVLSSGGRTPVLTSLFSTTATGLRLPTSSHDARFDREDPALEAEPEQGCCPCQHSPPGQALPALEAQEVTFQKKFENFLHHAITIPKCGPGGESLGGGGGSWRGGALWAGPVLVWAWPWYGGRIWRRGAVVERAGAERSPGFPRSPWKVTSINKSPQR